MRLAFLLSVCVVLLTACVSSPEKPTTARIDSYARPDALSFKTFFLVPAAGEAAQNSLIFQEMADGIVPILESIGMQKWSGDPSQPPDLFIDVKWMTPEIERITTSGTVPVFGQTGGGYTTHNSTSVVNGKLVTTTGSSYAVPTFGVTGSQSYTRTALLSSGGISLRAYEAKPFFVRYNRIQQIDSFVDWAKAHRAGYSDGEKRYTAAEIQARVADLLAEKQQLQNDKTPDRDVWFIAAWNVSRIPIEARLDYPRYLRAATAFIGKSSNGQKEIILPKNEPAN